MRPKTRARGPPYSRTFLLSLSAHFN